MHSTIPITYVRTSNRFSRIPYRKTKACQNQDFTEVYKSFLNFLDTVLPLSLKFFDSKVKIIEYGLNLKVNNTVTIGVITVKAAMGVMAAVKM